MFIETRIEASSSTLAEDKEVVVSLDDLPLNPGLRRVTDFWRTLENRFWGKLIEPEAMQAYFERRSCYGLNNALPL